MPIERLIAKVDNDFNISESDWIPRVAAWCIDALSQMNVLPMEKKQRHLEVVNKIAQFPYTINGCDIKVYDKHGTFIPNINDTKANFDSHNIPHHCHMSNAHILNHKHGYGDEPIHYHEHMNHVDEQMQITCDNPYHDHEVYVANVVPLNVGRNFVLDGNNIELNFETDWIIVETVEVKTYYDETYNCEVPYIYDDGLLLEALAWYVLFKYLSRGSKHQVYSLTSPNQFLNPAIQWASIKPKAMASVKIKLNNDDGWNNFFYNYTFNPRMK